MVLDFLEDFEQRVAEPGDIQWVSWPGSGPDIDPLIEQGPPQYVDPRDIWPNDDPADAWLTRFCPV